ncbi:MAG TPA: methyltransferase domain-containing protein, partial [Anaerolineales bacterium]|nr:methyltransferase domain-containing protein [Anaerolineales bacterium]
MLTPSSLDASGERYRQTRTRHWDAVATKRDSWSGLGGAYHARLRDIYSFLTVPGLRILEVGCGQGELLSALRPSRGVGVDFAPQMIRRARARYPHLDFIQADAQDLPALDDQFDVIIFSDLINDLWDVEGALRQVHRLTHPGTRLILNFYSGLWQLPLGIAQLLGLAAPMLPQNWLTPTDTEGMLRLAGFESIRSWQEILLPLPLAGLFNKILVRLWPFHHLALANFMIARPQPVRLATEPTVSVIVPARNEAGNIASIFQRLPRMGPKTELIFVEGHSRDDTRAT